MLMELDIYNNLNKRGRMLVELDMVTGNLIFCL